MIGGDSKQKQQTLTDTYNTPLLERENMPIRDAAHEELRDKEHPQLLLDSFIILANEGPFRGKKKSC